MIVVLIVLALFGFLGQEVAFALAHPIISILLLLFLA